MTNFLTKLGWWIRREPRVRQAAKTTIAACLAFLIAKFFGMPQAFWAAVVAIFVTQANIGASLDQALNWLWGSLLGVVVGGVVAFLAGDVLSLMLMGLLVTVLVLAYFAATSGPMRIACVNAAIIILGQQHNVSPLLSAGDRMIEVTIGTVVAIAVMVLILPVRAGPSLARHVSKTLPLYFELLAGVLTAAITGRYDKDAIAEANAKIRAAVSTNEALKNQALTEVAGFLANNPDPEPLITVLRRMWHTVLMLARAAASPLPASALDDPRGGLEELRDEVVALWDRLRAKGVHETKLASDLAGIDAALAKLTDATEQMRNGQTLRALPMEDVIRLLTFDFGLVQLRENIADLGNRTVLLDHLLGIAGPRHNEPKKT